MINFYKRLIIIFTVIINCFNLFAANYDLENNGVLYKLYSTSLAQMDIVGYNYNISEDLVIPSSVQYRKVGQTRYITYYLRWINGSAFDGCTKIKTLTFENSSVYVLSRAFSNCTNLSKIYLGSNKLGQEEGIFSGCTSITEIHTDISSPSAIHNNCFDETIYANAVLYVPEGCVEIYRNTDGWNKFSNITDGTSVSTYTCSITSTGNGEVLYNGYTIRNNSNSFVVNEGISVSIKIIPDNSYQVASVKVNSIEMIGQVTNGELIISNISTNINIEVSFDSPVPAQPYAVLSEDNTVLTFYYDDQKNARNGLSIGPFDWNSKRWNGHAEDITSVVFDDSFANCNTLTSTAYWFSNCKKLTAITGIINLKTSNVTNMQDMFYGCSGLTSLDVSGFKTDNVTSMYNMFSGCSGLTSLDLSNFNTVNVTNMDTMFGGCSGLTSLDLSNFNTSNVTDMRQMFVYCSGLTSLDLSNFNTVNVTNMDTMFGGCSGLTSLDLSNFNTSNVTDMRQMFVYCSGLTSLDLSNFKTDNVTDMSFMFTGCSGLTSLDISGFKTDKVKSMGCMFWGCSSLTTIFVGEKWNISNVTDGTNMFSDCRSLVGGRGTEYDKNHVDVSYAHIDEGPKNPGYLTDINGPKACTLSIKATGNGVAIYDGTPIRGKTLTFTVYEGDSAIVMFTPDTGYRIKSVKLNNTDVTSNVKDSLYTISKINTDTSLEVEFEAIPYTLSIKATGNGTVTYDGTAIREKTSSFTVTYGSSAVVKFTSDTGYRIKSVKLDSTNVTSSVVDNQYTISKINADTSLEIEFEAIPYTLSIKATGNGTVTYDGTAIREKTSSFTVTYGSSAVVKFTSDTGYRIKSVKLDSTNVTSSVVDNQYTISKINADTSLEIEFEAIPYTLSIKATGNGTVTYDGTAIREKTSSFTVTYGSSVVVKFTPDTGYRIKSVKLNSTDVTSKVSNGQYTISNITADTSLEVEFERITYSLSIIAAGNGEISYNDISTRDKTNTFDVVEGSSITLTISPDDGYRVKILKMNSVDVTTEIKDGKYTISSIYTNTTVEVVFEAIPVYTVNILAIGNGNVGYDESVVRNQSQSYSVREGSSVTISFSPDAGYRVALVKVNKADVTGQVAEDKLTISNIKSNTSIDVTFEVIPPTTYAMTVKSTGNGTVTYDGTSIRDKSNTFTVVEGTYATLVLTPDEGYRVKSVKLNNADVTSSVVDNQYTTVVSSDTSIEVEFEQIICTLSITSTGNGSATYGETSVRGKTSTFTVTYGTDAVVSFSPDEGYRIKSVKVNGTDVTSKVASGQYTIAGITSDTSLEVEFERITYALSITSAGYGSVSYNDVVTRGKTNTFSVVEGASATLFITADDGNRIKTLKVNDADVTSGIKDGTYTICSVTANTAVEAVFEAIPDYTVSILATGNGNVIYNGQAIRNQSQSYSVREGSSVTISFSPDAGYRVALVKVNKADVTGQVAEDKLTVSNITSNTSIDVTFEAIPLTKYTLTIKSVGNGMATYDGTSVRNETSTFIVTEGSYATVTFIPDNGYRIKSVNVDGIEVTHAVANSQFTISKISKNTSLEVEFEEIPPTTYTLAITAKGDGAVSYDGTSVRNQTSTFTVTAGNSALVSFIPDEGYRIRYVKLDGTDITANIFNNQYTIVNILNNTSMEVEFVEDVTDLALDGVNYTVISYDDATLNLATGDYGLTLTIPATISAKGRQWRVIGVEPNALNNCTELAAIEWNPETKFNGSVSNPNLLIYVKDKQYAGDNIQNVVVNNAAEEIVLVDANNGNNFYCPRAFTANRISYEHIYSMKSGYNTCQGWETLVLPFDVTQVLRQGETELVPYDAWQMGSIQRPFWLYSLTELGWKAETSIAANTPYLIGMPNNEMYDPSYNVTGKIQFVGANVQVKTSDNLVVGKKGQKKLVPNYQNQSQNVSIWALNVNNEISTNTESTLVEGSAFVQDMRAMHPFEAYLTATGSAASNRVISVFENGEATGIMNIPIRQDIANDVWYTIDGRKLQKAPTADGVYIRNGKKVVLK